MSAVAILEQARSLGVALRVEGDRIKAKGPRPAVERLLPALRVHKPELLVALGQPAPAPDPARICADCVNLSSHGNCRRPVDAGLSARFELIAAPEGHAPRCPAFDSRVKSAILLDPAEGSGHWLISLPPERLERWFSPAVTRAQLEPRYPAAVLIALPEASEAPRQATPEEASDAPRLLAAVAAREGFSEHEQKEALANALRDPTAALCCLRALLTID